MHVHTHAYPLSHHCLRRCGNPLSCCWCCLATAACSFCGSEQRLADAVWAEPANRELFARLLQPHLAALLAAGRDITEAKKSPDKVTGAGGLLGGL